MPSTPDNHERAARLAAAQAAWDRGEKQQARAAFETLARDFPHDDAIRFALAVIYYDGREYELAEPLLQAYAQRHPDNDAARRYLASIAERRRPKQDALPYQPSLPGQLLIGRATSVQLRTELNHHELLRDLSSNIEKRNVSILSMRVVPLAGGPPVAVELRGTMILGTAPREGDRVAVPLQRKNGALRVRRLQNLETGEVLTASKISRITLAVTAATYSIGILFVLTILAGIVAAALIVIPRVASISNGSSDVMERVIEAQPTVTPKAKPRHATKAKRHSRRAAEPELPELGQLAEELGVECDLLPDAPRFRERCQP